MYRDIFCWNVRGFNKQSHRSGFKKWVRSNKPFFGSLVETHVQQQKMRKFINTLLPSWSFGDNYAFSDLGKIWILWHPSVKVVFLFKSLQMVTCEVQFPDYSESVIVSFVYAANDEPSRRVLWNDLVSQASGPSFVGKAWAVLGDFNQVLRPSEHSTRTNLNMDSAMRDFDDALLQSSLMDLNYRGCSFTWWNKQRANPVAKKLDRILVNDEWQVLFPNSVGFFDAPQFSDHSPCCITLNSSKPRQKRPFKFYNYLLKNQDFLPLITDSWFSFNVAGSEMFRISAKLKGLKIFIRQFSKSNYSDLEKRVQEAPEALSGAQASFLSSPSSLNTAAELEATRKWEILSSAEERFLYQR